MKLIRFAADSSQAHCLTMLQEQETDTQVIDVEHQSKTIVQLNNGDRQTSPDITQQQMWKRRLLGATTNDDDVVDFDIISVQLTTTTTADAIDGGPLGLALEGTVDVIDGTQLCPHHYIESIRPHGPAAASGRLRSGDELLQVLIYPVIHPHLICSQVDDVCLYGESHITVRHALSRAAGIGKDVTLTVARRKHAPPSANLYLPSESRAVGPVLSTLDDRLVKVLMALTATLHILSSSNRRNRNYRYDVRLSTPRRC